MKNKILLLSVVFIFAFATMGIACYESGAPTISLDVPATAEEGSQILLTAHAADDHGVNYISLFDGDGYWLGGYFCGNTTKCEVSFLVTVPNAVGVEYSYKAYAYDIDGYSAEATGSGITKAHYVAPQPKPPAPEEPESELVVATFFIENADFIKEGDIMRFFFEVDNEGESDLSEISFSASIPELGVRAPTLRMKELPSGDSVSRMQYIELPADVPPGTYYLQLSINSKDARRVVYREFIVKA